MHGERVFRSKGVTLAVRKTVVKVEKVPYGDCSTEMNDRPLARELKQVDPNLATTTTLYH
jgi:hypothetical protein